MQVNADTANNALWDAHLERYIAFTRKDVKKDVGVYGVRREFRSESPDFETWTLATECARGEAGYEMYALEPWRNEAWRPGLYLAIGKLSTLEWLCFVSPGVQCWFSLSFARTAPVACHCSRGIQSTI